jgi:hypothetical protein
MNEDPAGMARSGRLKLPVVVNPNVPRQGCDSKDFRVKVAPHDATASDVLRSANSQSPSSHAVRHGRCIRSAKVLWVGMATTASAEMTLSSLLRHRAQPAKAAPFLPMSRTEMTALG